MKACASIRMLAADAAGEFLHPEDRRTYIPRKVEGWGVRERFAGELSAQELADMDYSLWVDRKLAEALVHPGAADAVAWGDLPGSVLPFGFDGPLPDAVPKRTGASGLVPVLTSGKRSLPASFSTLVERGQLSQALGAFPLDPDGRRVNSLRMQVGVAARLQCAKLAEAEFDCVMVTLTYKGSNEDWNPRHVSDFMAHVRKWCQRREIGCHYVWVAELQKRGTIHYHVALWLPKGVHLPKPDQCGWWPHGMTRIEVARAAVPYLLKYLSKGSTPGGGKLPRGARIYGMGGLDHAERRTRRWLGLPGFVQARSDVFDKWTRATGGGWQSPTGEHFASEFQMVSVGGVRCLMRVADHGADWRPDGPFTWLHRGRSEAIQ